VTAGPATTLVQSTTRDRWSRYGEGGISSNNNNKNEISYSSHVQRTTTSASRFPGKKISEPFKLTGGALSHRLARSFTGRAQRQPPKKNATVQWCWPLTRGRVSSPSF